MLLKSAAELRTHHQNDEANKLTGLASNLISSALAEQKKQLTEIKEDLLGFVWVNLRPTTA